MIRTFDELLNLANNNLQAAEGYDIEYSAAYAHLASVYILIAIAQELHLMNEHQKNANEGNVAK